MSAFLTPEVVDGLLAITAISITAIVGFVGRTAQSRWGLDIDARARETLHSALNTGALLALSKATDHVEAPTRQDLIKIVLRHVTGAGAGDAVTKLGTPVSDLTNLAEAKLTEVQAQLGIIQNPFFGVGTPTAQGIVADMLAQEPPRG